MSKWKRLDLIYKMGHPEPGELVAIRLVPKSGPASGSGDRYEIGCFQPDPRSGSKKLWWHNGRWGSDDPANLKKRYDIWWCPVAAFDGI